MRIPYEQDPLRRAIPPEPWDEPSTASGAASTMATTERRMIRALREGHTMQQRTGVKASPEHTERWAVEALVGGDELVELLDELGTIRAEVTELVTRATELLDRLTAAIEAA